MLDQGKVDNAAAIPGSLKVVVYDTMTAKELMRFDLGTVASLSDSFLNDIVLD